MYTTGINLDPYGIMCVCVDCPYIAVCCVFRWGALMALFGGIY